jgi:gliding motility-associated-like protein
MLNNAGVYYIRITIIILVRLKTEIKHEKMLEKLLTIIFIGTFTFSSIAQKNSSLAKKEREAYQEMKETGTIPANFKFSNQSDFSKKIEENLIKEGFKAKKKAGDCGCYVTPDATYTTAFAPNDDLSTSLLPIPFTFCLYGNNYNDLFINNNGNVSFGSAESAFSSNPFPDPGFVMVAPFWGDVDTRGIGEVKYKITPTAMYVNWESVGYYNSETDKVNTFQLIITDGNDPVLPSGNNIAFCYGDMQWTTGSASQGVNGFGGTPSTVGVNKGDGINFIQLGRFDQAGAFYDGPSGLNDGIDWLDNQSFFFNVCSGTNIPPIGNFTPAISTNGGGACDSIKMCGVNDTLIIDALFLSPEIGETTSIVINFNGSTGFSVVNNTPGNPAEASVQVAANISNAGLNTITFTATDDGVPSQTTIVNYNVFIDTTGFFAFNPEIIGDLEFCEGGNSDLTVSPTNLTSYIWSNGSIDTTINVDTTNTYWVTSELNGCYKTVSVDVLEHPVPLPLITGDTILCPGDSVLLNASLGYASYEWSTSSNDTLDSVYVTQGTYTVSVDDTNGCPGASDPFTVGAFPTTIAILGDTNYCVGDSVLLDAGSMFDTYLWSNGDTSQTTYVTAGQYTVDITLNTCSATSDTHYVTLTDVPQPVITGVNTFCADSFVTLNSDSIGTGYDSFSWNTVPIQVSQTINVNQTDTLIVVGTIDGCTDTSATFIVTEIPLPTPVIIGNLFYCANDSNGTTLSTTLPYSTYLWSNGDIAPITIATAGPVTLTVTNGNGCIGDTNVIVTSAAPNNNITGIVGFCFGENITIDSDAGFDTYLWDSGESTLSISAGHGRHIVTVTDINGCTDVDTVNLVGNPIPTAAFTASPTTNAQPNQPVVFTDNSSNNVVTWLWNFDATNLTGADPSSAATQGSHSITFSEQGAYTILLSVVSDSNCENTYSEEFLIISDIIVPNIITPNGDASNQFLVFKNLEFHSGNNLLVFNRWGNKVFEQIDYSNDWDGGGHSEGTYFYILTVNDLEEQIKGSLTILK